MISTIGMEGEEPIAVVAERTGTPAKPLLVSSTPEAGYGPVATRVAEFVTPVIFDVLITLFRETNIRTPDGIPWKAAWRRVPKSAKPVVPLGVLSSNPDSEL